MSSAIKMPIFFSVILLLWVRKCVCMYIPVAKEGFLFAMGIIFRNQTDDLVKAFTAFHSHGFLFTPERLCSAARPFKEHITNDNTLNGRNYVAVSPNSDPKGYFSVIRIHTVIEAWVNPVYNRKTEYTSQTGVIMRLEKPVPYGWIPIAMQYTDDECLIAHRNPVMVFFCNVNNKLVLCTQIIGFMYEDFSHCTDDLSGTHLEFYCGTWDFNATCAELFTMGTVLFFHNTIIGVAEYGGRCDRSSRAAKKDVLYATIAIDKPELPIVKFLLNNGIDPPKPPYDPPLPDWPIGPIRNPNKGRSKKKKSRKISTSSTDSCNCESKQLTTVRKRHWKKTRPTSPLPFWFLRGPEEDCDQLGDGQHLGTPFLIIISLNILIILIN